MSSRSEHMRKVNEVRSSVTTAMIYFLDDLEEGTGGDYHGFNDWGIKNAYKIKGQLNSYRAQKVAQFLGQIVSKQRLLRYSKPKGYSYSMTNAELMEWLNNNEDALREYYDFNKGVFTNGQG